MAALNTRSSQPTRLVLGKGGANSIGTIIAIVIFAIVALFGLSSFFNDGGEINPVILVVGGIIGLVVLVNLLNAIRTTNVDIDAGQGTATRTDSLLFFPVRRQDMSLGTVKDVRVDAPTLTGRPRANRMPVWQVQLRGSDGSTFVVNERGTRAEMDALADQVSQLVNRPIYSASNPTGQAPATVPASNAPNGSRYSFIDNLASFAGAGTPIAPTFSAYPTQGGSPSGSAKPKPNPQSPDAPYLQASAQLAAQQAAAGAQALTTNARMTANQAAAGVSSLQASAQLASQQMAAGAGDAAVNQQLAASQVAAGAPFAAASAQLAQQQAAGQAAMGYSLPPVLSMPQMPVLFSFAPPLDMPSFPPLGSPLQLQMTTLTEAPEIKQVQATVTQPLPRGSVNDLKRAIAEDPQDAAAQYALGRQLLGQRNLRDAVTALQRALGINPADAAAQNDLGVAFLEQNKLPDAERAFRRSMALDPFSSASRYNLGLTLYRMGKKNEADEQFNLGAQTATRDDVQRFQNARQGLLGSPILSPQDQIFREAAR